MTQDDLAERLNRSKSNISSWELGRHLPSVNQLLLIAEFTGRPKSEVMALFGASDEEEAEGGIDENAADHHPGKPRLRIVGKRNDAVADDITIPEYQAGGSMGAGVVLRDQPGEIRSWTVSRQWVQLNLRAHTTAKNLCVVTGFGDSMKPLFNPGDPLLIDAGVKVVDFEGVYFFRVGDEGFIKRLQRVPGRGLIALSDNKTYLEWVITPDMDFEVFGRVLKIWRGEDC